MIGPFPKTLSLKDCLPEETRLKQEDPEGILGSKVTNLAMHFTFFKKLGLNPKDLLLFEMGANPTGTVYMSTDSPITFQDANINHFLVKHKDKYFYRGFEPVQNKINWTFAALFGRQKQLKKYGVIPSEFIKELNNHCIKKFDVLQEELRYVRAENNLPVIFSSHTITDPSIKLDMPFWKEKGLHSHIFSTLDLERMYNSYMTSNRSSKELVALLDLPDPTVILKNVSSPNTLDSEVYIKIIKKLYSLDNEDVHVYSGQFSDGEALCAWYSQ